MGSSTIYLYDNKYYDAGGSPYATEDFVRLCDKTSGKPGRLTVAVGQGRLADHQLSFISGLPRACCVVPYVMGKKLSDPVLLLDYSGSKFYSLLESVRSGGETLSPKSLRDHPAASIWQMLINAGGSFEAIVRLIDEIGDLRVSLGQAISESRKLDSCSLETLVINSMTNNVFNIDRLFREARAAASCKDASMYPWLAAIFGTNARANALIGGTLYSQVVNQSAMVGNGMATVAHAVSQLVVSQWLASELHRDFFNSELLVIGNNLSLKNEYEHACKQTAK